MLGFPSSSENLMSIFDKGLPPPVKQIIKINYGMTSDVSLLVICNWPWSNTIFTQN